MKIVHLCLGNYFADNYSYQENLLPKYHVRMGYEVTVMASLFVFDHQGKGSYLPGPIEYDSGGDGFHVIRLANPKPVKFNRFFRRFEGLYEKLEREAPDIIFSHNVSYADTVAVRRYLKRHRGVKLFADNHADFINSARYVWSRRILHPVIWRHYAKLLEPFMEKCYGVTPQRCRFLKEMYHIRPDLVDYLPLGVDDDALPSDRLSVRRKVREELGIPEDASVIFTGGKIDRRKNTHVLVEALRGLPRKDIHLIICGVLTPSMASLEKEIEADDRIHYLGWCDAPRVMDCMVASDLACFPGTHSTLWEQAVGVGIPVVCKRWPEMEQVNVNGNCVFVAGDHAGELGEVLQRILSPDVFPGMSALAETASAEFRYSKIARTAINLP